MEYPPTSEIMVEIEDLNKVIETELSELKKDAECVKIKKERKKQIHKFVFVAGFMRVRLGDVCEKKVHLI